MEYEVIIVGAGPAGIFRQSLSGRVEIRTKQKVENLLLLRKLKGRVYL